MTTALITGASSGIGETFTKELASRGTNLILVARSEEKLNQLAHQLQEQHSIQTEVIVQDLTTTDACKTVFDTVTQKGLEVDLLVNNAGFGDYGPLAERPLEKQVNMIQLNVVALVELTHRFLAGMKQRGSGGIINVASIAAYQPLPYLSVYAATKAFVLNFTEAIWAENQQSGIHILALCPGPTDSSFFEVAEFPNSFGGRTADLTPPEEVVKGALKALEKNQSNLVTGGLGNQIVVNSCRFFPRELIVSLVEKQFRN
ncbi:MAG: SDR family NAD(P)-dependent oxidoreductase [Microcoleaceae cyanobacterium]